MMIDWSEIKLSSTQVLDILLNLGGTVLALVVVVFVGMLLGTLAARVARKIAVVSGFDALVEEFGIAKYWYAVGVHSGAADLVAAFFKWTVFVLTFLVAIDLLGIEIVTTIGESALSYLPDLVGGIALVLLGLIVAEWVSKLLKTILEASHLIESPDMVAKAIRLLLILAFLLIGAEQIGIKIELFQGFFLIVLGAVFLCGALAFGFGGKAAAQNLVHGLYVRQLIKTGDRVTVGDRISGEVLAFAPQQLVLLSDGAELFINYSMCVEENFSFLKKKTATEGEAEVED